MNLHLGRSSFQRPQLCQKPQAHQHCRPTCRSATPVGHDPLQQPVPRRPLKVNRNGPRVRSPEHALVVRDVLHDARTRFLGLLDLCDGEPATLTPAANATCVSATFPRTRRAKVGRRLEQPPWCQGWSSRRPPHCGDDATKAPPGVPPPQSTHGSPQKEAKRKTGHPMKH